MPSNELHACFRVSFPPCRSACLRTAHAHQVDYATDALVQRTLRSEFKGCTTFIIAHRLSTVCERGMYLPNVFLM